MSSRNLEMFRWLKDFFLLGLRDGITPDEIYATNRKTEARTTSALFETWWNEELQRPNPSLMRMLIRKYGASVMMVSLAFSMTDTVMRYVPWRAFVERETIKIILKMY